MLKLKRTIFSLATFLLMTPLVNAASSCGSKETAELNQEVVNIKVSYEEAEGILDPSEYTIPDAIIGTEEEETFEARYTYFKVSIINVSENFYIEVTNDINKEKLTFKPEDVKDGTVSFDWRNMDKVANFTIKVYASSNTNCEGEGFRSLYLTLPRVNDYFDYSICNGIEDYYLCQKYVTHDYVDLDTFMGRIKAYRESLEKEKEEINDEDWFIKATNFIKQHKVIFIGGLIVVVAIVGGTVVVITKKRRRDII